MINLRDYRFFWGGCKIFGLFGLFFGLGLLGLIFVTFWNRVSPEGRLTFSLLRQRKSKQKERRPD